MPVESARGRVRAPVCACVRFCARATPPPCVLRACLSHPDGHAHPHCDPCWILMAKTEMDVRALDPRGRSLGHCTRRRLSSERCVPAPRRRQPFLGSSQRYGKASRSVRALSSGWETIKLRREREESVSPTHAVMWSLKSDLTSHVEIVTS